ncbi:A/G-specific adenine glycosylase [Streptomyces sp. SCUT-3]|uniref:A/G-specific adenine glycosylase n=1 Tax=Streptomyces sp. SCUT-3 TaxID=2684469 RepID=UPI0015F827B9|nr:A/G-specific adenine glycosylase [Streptomyces sp. SCUT-3]QMV22731.1 A/G-specific adenine glycosylase [Streptomyces sp. SCUT-3]
MPRIPETTDAARSTGGPNAADAARAAGLLHEPILDWFEENARDLPWRRPEAGPWGVMVSEFMLQQTPVSRVLPVYEQWTARWPTPAALAADPPGEAVRAWGRLGYPRRALRLHAAATAITETHGGEVPEDHAALLALPGVGEYTAAAVASFAFGQRHAVMDTNVRRVFARAVTGVEYPANATTAAERRTAHALLPDDEATAARWAAATMELGALVCTARSPQCARCPVLAHCSWRLAGSPPHDGPPRRGQTYAGTDRQVRGKLLAVLREATGPVPQAALDAVWDEPVQRARALDGLVADGLVEPVADGVYRLPLAPAAPR